MGPLHGYRILELAGLGPCPMAGMLLADMGAEVICVDRDHRVDPYLARDISRRGKQSIILDLKQPAAREVFLRLVDTADALIEGYRPGVMERLGLAPEVCLERNPRLVYGRMTGWGQNGPLATNAGHDINYIALAGALHAMGPADGKPAVPLNVIGDYAGGALFLVAGVLAALLERGRSGRGQVVDAAMVDGIANLMWPFLSMYYSGRWDFSRRGANLLDGGAPFYDTYETADGKFLALGAIEPHFFAEFLERAGLGPAEHLLEAHADPNRWPQLKAQIADLFRQKTRDQWCALLEVGDACVSPVLTLLEAMDHPHTRARDTYIQVDDLCQPAPAPRFSRTPSRVRHGDRPRGADTLALLTALGFSQREIDDLLARGAAAAAESATASEREAARS
ncbi:MAG: CoA transferase [Porticoccaceae bacterium]|nr:MAG: CoA transferase [Porticoccaceae bacterium]